MIPEQFKTLEFDKAYIPESEVVDAANQLSGSMSIGCKACGSHFLASPLRSIKRIIKSQYECPPDDFLLYLLIEEWSCPQGFSEDALDTVSCTEWYIVIRRSVLIEGEIDESTGLMGWEDCRDDGFTATTGSGKLPEEVLEAFYELVESNSDEIYARYTELDWPDIGSLDPRVVKVIEKGLREDGSYEDWVSSRHAAGQFPVYYLHKRRGPGAGHWFFNNSYQQCGQAWKDKTGKWRVELTYPSINHPVPDDSGTFDSIEDVQRYVAEFYAGFIEEVSSSWMRAQMKSEM